MGCNCKSKASFVEKTFQTSVENENIISKITRNIIKVFFFMFAFISLLIATPIIVFYAVYKAVFSKDKLISMPTDKIIRFLKKNG